MRTANKCTWHENGTIAALGNPSWLAEPDLQVLMAAFEASGFRIFAVGGCVRDTILGRDVKDVDLSTDAVPAESVAIAESLGWKAVPTGIDHGTITVVASNKAYEITTFRRDVETHGRHATVAFSTSIEEDALRRDFTVNAFYADRNGNVFDVVGGSGDLANGRIRFIGNAADRIEEDYLRILRFFRFSASHGNRAEGIDADGLSACAELAEGLEKVSRERIGTEMRRLIAGTDPAPIVGSMEQAGVLNRILPGASVATLARLVDLEEQVEAAHPDFPARDIATRLAALGCEVTAERLRLSNADADKIRLVTSEAGSSVLPHALGYRYGYQTALHCLLLRWASFLAPIDETAIKEIEKGAAAVFPVAASDLMPAYSGRALGDRLKRLEAEWIDSRFVMSRSELLNLR